MVHVITQYQTQLTGMDRTGESCTCGHMHSSSGSVPWKNGIMDSNLSEVLIHCHARWSECLGMDLVTPSPCMFVLHESTRDKDLVDIEMYHVSIVLHLRFLDQVNGLAKNLNLEQFLG